MAYRNIARMTKCVHCIITLWVTCWRKYFNLFFLLIPKRGHRKTKISSHNRHATYPFLTWFITGRCPFDLQSMCSHVGIKSELTTAILFHRVCIIKTKLFNFFFPSSLVWSSEHPLQRLLDIFIRWQTINTYAHYDWYLMTCLYRCYESLTDNIW